MALFDKNNTKTEEMTVSTKTGGGDIDTLLGKGSEFEGKLSFKGQVRIDGKYSGHIQTDEVLVVGASARVNAEISAGTVINVGQGQCCTGLSHLLRNGVGNAPPVLDAHHYADLSCQQPVS